MILLPTSELCVCIGGAPFLSQCPASTRNDNCPVTKFTKFTAYRQSLENSHLIDNLWKIHTLYTILGKFTVYRQSWEQDW